ncbi:hypothetical protein KAZ01_02320 [Candidatus Gracilibacteria bacterium]|nr:hypothetical protein [Candidatus Gracilibacteria bacterium]
MNEKFKLYFKTNFFKDQIELDKFLSSLTKHLVKTIRINTNKTSVINLKKRLEKLNYKLSNTFINNVFYTERAENFDELEKRLGFSIEHLIGLFYIQELGASSSVYFLSNGKIDKKEHLILDMASSPGGKTTQLSEYYPNSFIVANEFDKNRTPQLISNIERMGSDNIGITCYNGQFIGRLTETFDKVLLDAPCSGEGIGFKSAESLKYWNIKNVKKISELQKKLFESGLNALKIGGEMLYSTCTMNKIENEQIIDEILKKHPGSFKIIFQKRFWPHIDETGGFFVCKIQKLKSISYHFTPKKELFNTEIKSLEKHEEKILDIFCNKNGLNLENYLIFKYKNEMLALKKQDVYEKIKNRIYFFKLGKKIGKIEGNRFVPNYYVGRDFELEKVFKYKIKDSQELDNYLRGQEIGENIKENLIQIQFEGLNIGLGTLNKETGKIRNLFPTGWMRR